MVFCGEICNGWNNIRRLQRQTARFRMFASKKNIVFFLICHKLRWQSMGTKPDKLELRRRQALFYPWMFQPGIVCCGTANFMFCLSYVATVGRSGVFFSTAHNRCTCGKGLFHQSFFFRIGFRWIQLVTFVFYWTRFESAVLKVFSNKNTEHTVHDMLMSSLVIDTRYKFVQNIWRHSLFPSCFFALCRRIAVQYMSQKVIPKWRTHFGRKMYMAKQDMNIYICLYI